MSVKFLEQLKEIEDSKEDIARAIALSVCNGDEVVARENYGYFKYVLVNKTKPFIVEVKGFSSTYMKETEALIKKLRINL